MHTSLCFFASITTCSLLISCTTPNGGNSSSATSGISQAPETSAWDTRRLELHGSLNEVPTLTNLPIGILRSPSLEKKWGKPSYKQSPAGDYSISYRHPTQSFENLVIYGSQKPFPILTSAPEYGDIDFVDQQVITVSKTQDWQTVTILGKKVRLFITSPGGGADGAMSSTEGFTLSAPDGRTGYYRLEIEENGSDDAIARFRSVSW